MSTMTGYFLIFLVLLSACSRTPPQRTGTRDCGTVLSVEYVPESFAGWAKTNITTTEGVFVTGGTRSVFIGDEAWLDTYDTGKRYLCVGSWDSCSSLWGG